MSAVGESLGAAMKKAKENKEKNKTQFAGTRTKTIDKRKNKQFLAIPAEDKRMTMKVMPEIL